ncbi:hypothetical protein DFJ77DRAFT_215648 [Powellomyces hirtus]|nr:hypothetical protein DFJ77DRAFT_215648 [Powellomyces hirtus]
MTLTPDTQVLPSHPTPSHPYTFYVRDTHTGVQCNAESQLAMVSWLNILVRAGQHTERTRPVTLIPIRPQQQQQQMQPGEKPASRIPVTAAAYPERLSNGIDAKMVMGMNKHYHHHHHPRRMPEEEEAISNNNNNNNNNSIRDGAISPAGSVDSRLTNKDIRNSTTINNNNNNNNTNNNNNSINRPAGPAKNGLFAAAEH